MSKPAFDTTGLEQAGPGIWFDPKKKTLHIDTRAICEHLKIPVTKENEAMVEKEAIAVCHDLFGNIDTTVQYHPV
jgi:hypothetical protein